MVGGHHGPAGHDRGGRSPLTGGGEPAADVHGEERQRRRAEVAERRAHEDVVPHGQEVGLHVGRRTLRVRRVADPADAQVQQQGRPDAERQRRPPPARRRGVRATPPCASVERPVISPSVVPRRVHLPSPRGVDRVRPTYPDELFADLLALTGGDGRTSVLEVGCGTGQATRSLAPLVGSVTAVEPGAALATLARRRLASFPNVGIETSSFEEWDDGSFEEWDDGGRRFDLVVAASSWHWVDPAIGWPKAHRALEPGGWMALLGHVVVRRPGEAEVYAETADLHERFAPGDPGWGHPPLEHEVRATDCGWGAADDPGGRFGPPIVRWYPTVQRFDGQGVADHLRTTSLYRRLEPGVREALLDAVAERIRTRMGDRAVRRYLSDLRIGRRAD